MDLDLLPALLCLSNTDGRLVSRPMGMLWHRCGRTETPARVDDLLSEASAIFVQTHVLPLLLNKRLVEEIAVDLAHMRQGSGGSTDLLPAYLSARVCPGMDDTRLCWLFYPASTRHAFEIALIRQRNHAERQASMIKEQFAQIQQLNEELLQVSSELKLRNQELNDLAFRDSLTHLFNRRVLRRVELEMSAKGVSSSCWCILMLDIDHFKRINDTYGHDQGDETLVAVAEVLSKVARKEDLIVRYGGEEFLIVLRQTSASQAEVLASRIHDAIRRIAHLGFLVTVSIGIAEDRSGSEGFWSLQKRADAALYRAKRNGRNRTELAEDDRLPQSTLGQGQGPQTTAVLIRPSSP